MARRYYVALSEAEVERILLAHVKRMESLGEERPDELDEAEAESVLRAYVLNMLNPSAWCVHIGDTKQPPDVEHVAIWIPEWGPPPCAKPVDKRTCILRYGHEGECAAELCPGCGKKANRTEVVNARAERRAAGGGRPVEPSEMTLYWACPPCGAVWSD